MITRRRFLAAASACAAGAPSLLAFGAEETSDGISGEMISLVGDPRTVGRQFGRLNGEHVRRHVGEVLDGWRKRGLSDGRMMERTRPFRRFVARFAPAWMDEITACAEAARVDPDHYVAFLAGKWRSLFFIHECTSFLAVGEASADGATLFHKNRDNVSREQTIHKKKVLHGSNPAAFYNVGDTSDMGSCMMLNEHGLAGSADMGGLREDRPKGRGVMNGFILRLIAERAQRCEDALEIVQQMIRDGWYAGGTAGTHWLFGDRFGKGLRIAQNSHEEQHWFVEDDVLFLARQNTSAGKRLAEKKGKITVRDINAAASHPDICRCSSISAMSTRVDPDSPAELSTVWSAQPAWLPYVPLFPTADVVPRELADGNCYLAGHDQLKFHTGPQKGGSGIVLPGSLLERRAEVQQALYAQAEDLEPRIRTAFRHGRTEEAAGIAADGMLTCVSGLMRYLAEVPKRIGSAKQNPEDPPRTPR